MKSGKNQNNHEALILIKPQLLFGTISVRHNYKKNPSTDLKRTGCGFGVCLSAEHLWMILGLRCVFYLYNGLGLRWV